MTEMERLEDLAGRTCRYCENEPEPGWIEMDNNGPIVRCPVCEYRARARSPEHKSPAGERE